MESLSLEKFALLLEGSLTLPQTTANTCIENVSIHSGWITSDCAFFALQSGQRDGHDYIDSAVNNECAAVVTAETYQRSLDRPLTVPHIAVPKPLEALQKLAAWWRAQLDQTTVVAITGSTGKTITKDTLVHLCAPHFRTFGSPGSFNSQLGVPLALLQCPRTAELAFIEVAASEPTEMVSLTPLVAADHVVITNVNTRWQHNFTDRSHQISELLSIADTPSPGWILAPDDEIISTIASEKVPQKRFYDNQDHRLCRFESNAYGSKGITAKSIFPNGDKTSITFGTHQVTLAEDMQLAASAAHLLGVEATSILRGITGYSPTSMRTELWQSPKGFTIMRERTTPDPLLVAASIETARTSTRLSGNVYFVLGTPDIAWTPKEIGAFTDTLAANQQLLIYGLDVELHKTIAVQLQPSGLSIKLKPSAESLSNTLLELLMPGDVCLIQSPENKELTDLGNVMIDALAPNRLHVDLSALEHNVTAFRKKVGPNVKMTAMVKAMAYGLDAVAVSKALERMGIDYFGVSNIDEGVELRQGGITKPIMAMLATDTEIAKAHRSDIELVIYSPRVLELVLQQAASGRQITVHLEVNSGMNRAGFKPDSAKEAMKCLVNEPNITFAGVMTHIGCAELPEKDSATRTHLARFQSVVDYAKQNGINILSHAAQSATLLRFPDAHHDMVRIGLGLYGLYPDSTEDLISLKPVARFMSRLVQVIEVPEGEGVGYSHTFIAPKGGTRIGVIPAGYFDGLPRLSSNRSYVVIAGKRCPMVGNISMDSMTVDISTCEEAIVGSDVLIYGELDGHSVPMEAVADLAETIAWEVTTKIGPRVQRIFSWH